MLNHFKTILCTLFFVACSTTPVVGPGINSADEADLRRIERERRDKAAVQADQDAAEHAELEQKRAHEEDMAKGAEPRGTSKDPKVSPSRQFPESIAGFRLGGSFSRAAATCVDAGGSVIFLNRRYEPTDSAPEITHFVCTVEPVETGFSPAFVAGRRCPSGSLCEITLPLSEKYPVEDAIHASKKMRERYGAPNEEEGESFLKSFVSCTKPGAKMRRDIWTWFTGGLHASRLIVAMSCKTKAIASIIYQDAEGMSVRVMEMIEKEQNY